MNNEIIIDGKMYKLESIWRKNKNDMSKDSKGNLYPFPEVGVKWTGQTQFINKLTEIQNYLETLSLKDNKCKNCLLCNKKCVSSKRYILKNYIWDNGLLHYIKKHNIQPNRDFIDKIFNYNITINTKLNLIGRIKLKEKEQYLKLEKNQLMILDALMKHGGYNKKYYDLEKKNLIRYSEHAGFFDIRENIIHNIIVSGNTLRVDRGDEEIFLPINTSDTFEYEYIFHTHPPTPKPGGRASDGILYEFPSLGDILHFIDHYNDGKTIGSMIMTPEGLYNIRKIKNDGKKININENDLYNEMKKMFKEIQKASLTKYGTKFTTYFFYSNISQDISFINEVNNNLQKYYITIDFFPRTKDFRGSWIVDTIYIPIYRGV